MRQKQISTNIFSLQIIIKSYGIVIIFCKKFFSRFLFAAVLLVFIFRWLFTKIMFHKQADQSDRHKTKTFLLCI